MTQIELNESGSVLTLIPDADGTALRFHAIWLRDNAQDETTRSAANGQRLIALRDIPAGTKIDAAEIISGHVRLTFQPEAKTIDYDIEWLTSHAYDLSPQTALTGANIETWDAGLANAIPTASLPQLQQDPAVLSQWLAGIARYGFGKAQAVDAIKWFVVERHGFEFPVERVSCAIWEAIGQEQEAIASEQTLRLAAAILAACAEQRGSAIDSN